MSDTYPGLAALPLQDVVFPFILPRLSPQDWCTLRAVDRTHHLIVTQFLESNRVLELPYCKQLTEPALQLLTQHSTSLRILTLSGCKLLTDGLLRPLLISSPQLTSLDLSECHHLTSGILQTVTMRCPRLSKLILRDCHWVSRVALEYHCQHQGYNLRPQFFPSLPADTRVDCLQTNLQPEAMHSLQEVDLTGCWELDDATVINLIESFPRLKVIRLGNIYSLTDKTLQALATHSRCLTELDIRGCWRTTDQGLSLVGEYCKGLSLLAVHDCRDITEHSLSRLRHKGVKIDRKVDPIMLRLIRMRREARVQV